MADEYVVELGVKFLSECFTPALKPELVVMLEYIDYYGRVGATLDEINEALARSPAVFVHRVYGNVAFAPSGDSREITAEELTKAFADYHQDFNTRHEKLTGRKLRL